MAPLLAALLLPFLGPRADAGPDAPRVLVQSADGSVADGRLVAVGDGALSLEAAAGPKRVALADLREAVFPDAAAAEVAPLAHLRVHLVGGEVLLGTFAGAVPDGIQLGTRGLGTLSIPFEKVRTIVSVPPGADACFEPEQTRRARADEDVIHARSGDEYAGIVLAADDEGFQVETTRGATRRVAWEDVLVVQLANEAPPPPEGLVVEVETPDGDRLRAAAPPSLDGAALRFALASLPGAEVALPLVLVRAVRASGGSFRYASDLPWESTFTPLYGAEGDDTSRAFLDAWYGARADRRRSGCPLRLGGRVLRHGFALQSRTVVTVPLDGRYATLRCLVGIDDEAVDPQGRPGGDAAMRVLADGKVLWEASSVKGGEAPREVGPLDVRGAARLVLEVDYGEGLNVLDRVTIGDPILTRAP